MCPLGMWTLLFSSNTTLVSEITFPFAWISCAMDLFSHYHHRCALPSSPSNCLECRLRHRSFSHGRTVLQPYLAQDRQEEKSVDDAPALVVTGQRWPWSRGEENLTGLPDYSPEEVCTLVSRDAADLKSSHECSCRKSGDDSANGVYLRHMATRACPLVWNPPPAKRSVVEFPRISILSIRLPLAVLLRIFVVASSFPQYSGVL